MDGSTAAYRKRALDSLENKCLICGYDVVDILQVHHKDKNKLNSDMSNLVVLCRNCHGEVHLGLKQL